METDTPGALSVKNSENARGGYSPRERIADRVLNCGLAANIALALLKVGMGIIGHSRALLADGINSTSDVAYYIVVKVFTKLAAKPADREHPYGHHQFESIASVVVGAFVITTAIAIFWDSVNAVYHLYTEGGGDGGKLRLFSMVTACGTIAVKTALFLMTRSAARATGNTSLVALALDHRNDILSSAGAAIGIALSWAGMPWGDPVAGACVALIVMKTGIDIIRESSDELMDTIPGDDLERQVRRIASSVDGVETIEHLQAHRFGPYFVVNITIGIDGDLSVARGDQIATEVEQQLTHGIGLVRNIYVHFHPAR